MEDPVAPETFADPETETRRLFVAAGTAYGVVFGLTLALLTWGYDALHLLAAGANLPWAKVVLGVPLSLAICVLVGNLASTFPQTAVSVALWTVAGTLLGLIAGHIPFEGRNLIVWLVDRRLWGQVVFPYGSSAAVRTTLILIVGAGVGAASGLLERLALEWAWDRATPKGRMSVQSWAVLLVCLPLILLLTGANDEMINRPLRAPQRSVAQLISLTLAEKTERAKARGLNVAAVKTFRESFSDNFDTHLVTYDLSPPQIAFVDAVFDNGFALRCRTVGNVVTFCDDVSSKLEGWMDDLIFAGLHGERRWMDRPAPSLIVEDQVVRWLQNHPTQLSETYELSRTGQQGRFVFMTARFDTGFDITCRFRGTQPIAVDQCTTQSRAQR
jgi:hypothetical protein